MGHPATGQSAGASIAMSDAMNDIAVCIPTVRERADELRETIRQWRALGIDPLVELQDDGQIRHASSQYHTANRAVLRALDRGTSHVLLAEDDVDLHPWIERVLPTLLEYPLVTLYLPVKSCYPRTTRAAIDGAGDRGVLPRVEPVVSRSMWYGGQGMLMSRDLAEAVARHEPLQFGWDAHLREWCIVYRVEALVAIPNLMQQRDCPPASTRFGGRHRSPTYAWGQGGR